MVSQPRCENLVQRQPTADLAEIHELTAEFRLLFEDILASSLQLSETRGSCLQAAILLARLLERFANAKTQVKGGGPPLSGGLFDPTGKCHGHYWVEGETSRGVAFIADVTADQFGLSKVLVLYTHAGRHMYSPGSQVVIDEHVRAELETWAV